LPKENTDFEQDIKEVVNKLGSGPHKVQSYSQSAWLLDSDIAEIRVASLYDLEAEVEVIQEQ